MMHQSSEIIQGRLATNSQITFGATDSRELLVPDERAALRPAQQVERKLIALLKDNVLPFSQVHFRVGAASRVAR